jgi:TolB protein
MSKTTGTALFILLAAASQAMAGSASDAGGRIVLVSTESGNAQIYAMNADGSGRQALTVGPEEHTQPVWSPDGRRIAYTALLAGGNMEIFVMDVDGSNKRRLTDHVQPDDAPSWSPDGKRIVFRSYRDRHANLYVMDADGSNLRRLTDSASDKGNPQWSPDGSRIAYQVYGDSGKSQLHVMKADGSDDRDITSAISKDKKTQPTWSPDGSKLAFVSIRNNFAQIYVVNADGSKPANLTDNGYDNAMPAWSPDGRQIAFVSNRYSDVVGRSEGDIYLMNTDGSGVVNLTRQPGNDDEPRWSADGKTLYYLSLRDGPQHLYALRLDGGPAARMTGHTGHDLMFSLSSPPLTPGKPATLGLAAATIPSIGN